MRKLDVIKYLIAKETNNLTIGKNGKTQFSTDMLLRNK